ncbi:MAG TPA: serine/threonine-protein kinase [Gemmatimonadales bacterium]|nr:serine/threonine-protein kinase [Gemmatimonadales bacterium]
MAAPLIAFAEPSPLETQLSDSARRIAAATRQRYAVEREIGRGGMSRVYLAWDRQAARQVAIKLLLQGPYTSLADRERFRREALIAARLEHPHIVPCHEFVCVDGLALAVMRFVPGESLADALARGRRFDPAEVVALLAPIADALAHAHRDGVIHRDVKPANILLHGDDGWPFLTDFGIATLRTSEQSRSESAKAFGTPEFMSSEQAAGAWDADHRGDLYSLGLVAYLLLAGRLPFRGTNALALAAQRVALEPPSLASVAPHVPPRLARVVDRCLERNPRRRWRDAATLRRALLDALRPRTWRWWAR